METTACIFAVRGFSKVGRNLYFFDAQTQTHLKIDACNIDLANMVTLQVKKSLFAFEQSTPARWWAFTDFT